MPVAVVTGASTGIGRDAALRLDSLGWTVFAGVRKDADAESLRKAGSARLRPIPLDVTNAEHVAAAADLVANEFGELDALVNNAGIGGGGPFEFIDLDVIRNVFEVNVYGAIRCCQAFLPLLRAGETPGRITNVSSIGGRWAGPYLGPYHMSKWALEAYSDSLRMELAPWEIEVAVIEPGTITTEIWKKADSTIQDMIDGMSPEIGRAVRRRHPDVRPGRVEPAEARHPARGRLGRDRALADRSATEDPLPRRSRRQADRHPALVGSRPGLREDRPDRRVPQKVATSC